MGSQPERRLENIERPDDFASRLLSMCLNWHCQLPHSRNFTPFRRSSCSLHFTSKSTLPLTNQNNLTLEDPIFPNNVGGLLVRLNFHNMEASNNLRNKSINVGNLSGNALQIASANTQSTMCWSKRSIWHGRRGPSCLLGWIHHPRYGMFSRFKREFSVVFLLSCPIRRLPDSSTVWHGGDSDIDQGYTTCNRAAMERVEIPRTFRLMGSPLFRWW